MVEENYDKGIELILQWMSEVEKVTAQSYSLLGQAYFQTGDYNKSLSAMETAVSMAEEEGYKPRENWYVILAACIGELKKDIGEKESLLRQIGIYEILVNLYPKKLYFIQLGGSYGQLGREKDYMITLKTAYQKDFLDKESEYLALSQLLLLNKNPYWAAEVLVSGQKKMVTIVDDKTKEEKIVPVVKDTEKNLKLLADSWRMAQEIDKAIPVLEKAAKISKDGKSYVLLGNLYLSEDRVDKAVEAIKKGLEKGKITKLSEVYLTLGQAYFELQKFDEAKKNFRIAARDKEKKIKTQANNWIKYTENEEIRVKNLALRRDYIQMNSSSS
jgi:tetratricopeptide (TPR) repeat protein